MRRGQLRAPHLHAAVPLLPLLHDRPLLTQSPRTDAFTANGSGGTSPPQTPAGPPDPDSASPPGSRSIGSSATHATGWSLAMPPISRVETKCDAPRPLRARTLSVADSVSTGGGVPAGLGGEGAASLRCGGW
eukprot:1176805-Prorocentrum_minimum.AAC.1